MTERALSELPLLVSMLMNEWCSVRRDTGIRPGGLGARAALARALNDACTALGLDRDCYELVDVAEIHDEFQFTVRERSAVDRLAELP